MRVALVTWGSRGDVQPFLGLARAFARAGHDVTLGAPPFEEFARSATAQGVPFASLGPPVDAGLTAGMVDRLAGVRNPWRQVRVLQDEMLLPGLEQSYRECLTLGRAADVVVSHFFQPAARMAAETLGRPFVSATLAPFGLPTRYRLPPPLPSLGQATNRIIWRLGMTYANRALGDGVNRARRRVGLPPLADLNGDGFYGDLNLIAVSPRVIPPPPDWAPRHRVSGYWFLDRPDWNPPPALAEFVGREPKPIAIGFGSMTTGERARLTRLLIEAVRRSGTRAVLQSGWAELGEAELPPGMFLAGDVPHDWLFPRVSAVVHHGGAGTSAAAFRAGVPSVFVPHIVDQLAWALTARQLGVAPRWVGRRALTASRLAGAIRAATTDSGMRDRAARLGAGIRAEDGAGTAVRLVESYVHDGATGRPAGAPGRASPGSRTSG